MYKFLFYIITLLFISTNCIANKKATDWTVTYRANDKNPYGCYVAYNTINKLFTNPKMVESKRIPDLYDYNKFGLQEEEKEIENSNELRFIIANTAYFNSGEIDYLKAFVAKGNYVFISATFIDEDLLDNFNLEIPEDTYAESYNYYAYYKYYPQTIITQTNPTDSNVYYFKGKRLSHLLAKRATEDDEVFKTFDLGYNMNAELNFVKVPYGNGCFYFHSAPLAFTNFFLMQKEKNKKYLETVLSHIPKTVNKITWSQYNKRMPNVEDKESEVSLEELFKYPMLKIAILLCILALTLYVLFNGKRKLEPIPVIEPITNTSIDFANSVGELYFNNKDNKNLAEKIINQYLEGIRSKYNMPTHTFDDNFFNKLSVKTNTPLATIKNIFTEIKHVQQNDFITDPQLQNLYNQIKQQKH